MFKRSLSSLAVLGLSAALVVSGGSVASAAPATGTGTASNLLYSVNGGPWTADASANRGDTVTARLFYDNSSDGTLSGTSLTTAIPDGFTYVPGSTRNVLAPGSNVATGAVGAETKAAAVADSVWSGGTLTVSPSAGFNGEPNTSQSGVLRNGVKRYLNLEQCAWYRSDRVNTITSLVPTTGSADRAAATNVSSTRDTTLNCATGSANYPGMGNERGITSIDLLGNKYLNLHQCAWFNAADRNTITSLVPTTAMSARSAGTNSSNSADVTLSCGTGDARHPAVQNERGIVALDLVGSRYLNLHQCGWYDSGIVNTITSWVPTTNNAFRSAGTNASNTRDSALVCGSGQANYPASPNERGLLVLDLSDPARGQGFVEFRLTSDVPPLPACGESVTVPAVVSSREGVLSGSGTGTPVSSASITLNEYSATGEDCPVEPALPRAVDDVVATTQDVPVTIDVLANDTDVESVTVTAGQTGPFHGAVVVNADNTITYTPEPGFFGIDSFTYTVTDAEGNSSTATVDVTIAEEDDGIPLVAPGIAGVAALAGLVTFGLRRRLTA
ncbi:cadherin-like domain-containing protein [Oerskovia enterophila]|uniref:cadherin-like domain-containing protein n=1 Tax=Oerskovia enterophila TaxID=43678 RepID=UPI0037FC2AED